MFKKLNISSPLGIALSLAGIALAMSPTVRKTIRTMMVKGTASAMDAMENFNSKASNLTQAQGVTWTSRESGNAEIANSLLPVVMPAVVNAPQVDVATSPNIENQTDDIH